MNEAVMAVLLAAGAAVGLTTSLAALLLLAERYLVNYGICKIDINEGSRELEVEGGGTLLQTLKEQGVFIPSACGGRGTCAYCKVTIREGGGPMVPTEEPLLTHEEKNSEVRIACQLKVRNDMRIEIPEELFNIKEYVGTVERIRDLTHDIKELRIALEEPGEISFTAGQYVQLEAPAYGDNPEPVYRAYSISSNPDEKDHIELIVRLVPGGICTTYVFEHLKEGDPVRFNREFRLSDSLSEMLWIAGGSGMAPFWSMVRHMKAHGLGRPTRYFFGAVKERDLFFVDELNRLAEELDWFEFIPALSGDVGDQWNGDKGLITEVLDRHVSQDGDMEGYLCGSPGMIDAAIAVLNKKGIGPERIYYDKFA